MTLNLLAVTLLLAADLAGLVPPTKLQLPALLAIGFEVLALVNAVFAVSWLFSSRILWNAEDRPFSSPALLPLRERQNRWIRQ